MRTTQDIENYLTQLGADYKVIKEGLWMVNLKDVDIDNLVISYVPPLVVFRINLMPVPEKRREEFFKRLLELNAMEMIHGAYGLEGDKIVLIDTLQVENLDLNEIQASIEALYFAVSHHFQELTAYLK
ncbi:MAG TPA: YbjN domain-containing protein [Candidatus Eremiobacteraeota bacterium]|nr:MAG: hypothetical protein BWY64_01451 [bacterium ADurb.Bin363]HPZ06928.1 YbjN domain-containing protein [Candidatus Eremiobacteraeota bacterium]